MRKHSRFSASFGILLLNICLAISSIGLWWISFAQKLDWRSDFSAYYTGWTIIRSGAGTQLYDFATEQRYQKQILGVGRSFSDGLLPYINPPHTALPFLALSLVPLRTAYIVWTICQLGLLVWLLWLLTRIAKDWPPHARRLMLVAVCAFTPLMHTFLLGTFSLLMLIFIIQFYLALKQRHETYAGFWLVLGTLKF